MKYFLSLPEHPTAYLAGYDDIAIGAMRAISEAGLRIPEDIAIIGNDNGRDQTAAHPCPSGGKNGADRRRTDA